MSLLHATYWTMIFSHCVLDSQTYYCTKCVLNMFSCCTAISKEVIQQTNFWVLQCCLCDNIGGTWAVKRTATHSCRTRKHALHVYLPGSLYAALVDRPVSHSHFSPTPANSVLSRRQPTHIALAAEKVTRHRQPKDPSAIGIPLNFKL